MYAVTHCVTDVGIASVCLWLNVELQSPSAREENVEIANNVFT